MCREVTGDMLVAQRDRKWGSGENRRGPSGYRKREVRGIGMDEPREVSGLPRQLSQPGRVTIHFPGSTPAQGSPSGGSGEATREYTRVPSIGEARRNEEVGRGPR